MNYQDDFADLIPEDLKPNDERLVEIVTIAEAAAKEAQDVSTVIPTGYEELDKCMKGGFREGDFTVITGIPGEGKTTLARMFTLHLANRGIPSLWFSHEMSNTELWESFREMGADSKLVSYVPIQLEDDTDWMYLHIKQAVEKYQVKAVFIDTLGDLVKTIKNKQELANYSLYLEKMCKEMRDFAIKNHLMLFVTAHATKQTKSRTNETDNSDIAHSNGIPATATNILHVWRDLESDAVSYVKIGKSRRDGTKKGWVFKMLFNSGRLNMEARHLQVIGEDVWKATN